MLRFDPSQPEHARFLTPLATKKQETNKKGKKKLQAEKPEESRPEEVRPEVSKEQFYKVSDTLKEAIAQPNTFSLRSLFGNNETIEEGNLCYFKILITLACLISALGTLEFPWTKLKQLS